MAQTIARYIAAANVRADTIRYRWDDWNVGEAEGPFDPELLGRLSSLSQRANVALAIATAEWIVYRFDALLDHPLPMHYLEAAWAQVVDIQYSFPWQLLDEETWTGPVKSPVRRTLQLVVQALEAMVSDGNPALSAASISKLAEHVLPDPAPYLSWREQVLGRLERFYAIDPQETQGDVVPRQALDPDFDFTPELTASLVNGFLAALNPEENPMLHSRAEMIQEGFVGTPYRFDLEADRRARFEW